MKRGFVGSAPNSTPQQLTALPPLLTEYLRQRISATKPVKEPKCIADIALPRGVRPDQQCERSEAQLSGSEVLESFEPKFGKHWFSRCKTAIHSIVHHFVSCSAWTLTCPSAKIDLSPSPAAE